MPRHPTPDRTSDQRRAGLRLGIERRQQRAQLRADLAAGRLTLRQLLQHHGDPIIGRMLVATALRSLPAIGPVKTAHIMASLDLAPDKRVAGLGRAQRDRLLAEIEDRQALGRRRRLAKGLPADRHRPDEAQL